MGDEQRNTEKIFWRNFWAYLFPFPVLYHNTLVKLRSILGPEESGIAFWLFIWPYVLMFQWLPLHKISLDWSDRCLRAFQSHSNRSRFWRPDEDCEIIRADLLHNAGCRQLEINTHLFSLSVNALQSGHISPKQVEGSCVRDGLPPRHQTIPGSPCQAMQVFPFTNIWRKHQDIK